MTFSIVSDPVEDVKAAFPDVFTECVESFTEFRGELTLYIKPELIVKFCQTIRDHETLRFDMLPDLTAVDHLREMKEDEPRFHVVYHLFSTKTKRRIRLKVPIWEDACEVDSVLPVWPAADWHEREVYDLFGISFTNHPDLRRIMMPDDWEGHPLRKDYPTTDQEVFEYLNKNTATQ